MKKHFCCWIKENYSTFTYSGAKLSYTALISMPLFLNIEDMLHVTVH